VRRKRTVQQPVLTETIETMANNGTASVDPA
jgi:hypothetical protein